MESYRLFLIFDGHIGSAREFEADDDRAAVALAEELRAGRPAELWSRARLVRTFEVRQDA